MILVDKNIKELARNKKLIIDGYNEDNVKNSSYDLVVDKIIKSSDSVENKENTCSRMKLQPSQFIYVKMKEKLHIPENILGIVAQKNSIMRLGLVVDGPNHQPGHKTNIYLRVQNISPNEIEIEEGQILAQMIFEELKSIPDNPYNKDTTASFNDEFEYSGFGKYKSKYNKLIEKVEKKEEKLDNMENRIYGNMITFMGIFISIFSVININFKFFSESQLSLNELVKYATVINLSLLLVIYVLFSSIFYVINKKSNESNNIRNIISIVVILILLGAINIIGMSKSSKYEEMDKKVKQEYTYDNKDNIKKLQELLKADKYDVEVNGTIDKKTNKAIEQLKKESKIETDSILDLIIYLNKEIENNKN